MDEIVDGSPRSLPDLEVLDVLVLLLALASISSSRSRAASSRASSSRISSDESDLGLGLDDATTSMVSISDPPESIWMSGTAALIAGSERLEAERRCDSELTEIAVCGVFDEFTL